MQAIGASEPQSISRSRSSRPHGAKSVAELRRSAWRSPSAGVGDVTGCAHAPIRVARSQGVRLDRLMGPPGFPMFMADLPEDVPKAADYPVVSEFTGSPLTRYYRPDP